MFLSRSRRASALLLLTMLLSALPALSLSFSTTPAYAAGAPTSVTIPGTIQSKLGCSDDWKPDCAKTHLTYDANSDIWRGEWTLPAGDYEYKAAINDSWTENYGKNAVANGSNIALHLDKETKVKFYYDPKTHWVTDNVNSIIASAPGNFQKALGCSDDWKPDCLRTWLEDIEGKGIYTYLTTALKAGNYETKVAINESWDENYGASGEKNGSNISFNVPKDGAEILFKYDSTTHVMTVGGPQKGNLALASAYWIARDTIMWNVPRENVNTYKLHYDPNGALNLVPEGVQGGQTLNLTPVSGGLTEAQDAQFPYLRGFTALKIDPTDVPKVPDILKGQTAVSITGPDGKLMDATSLQIAGVLDDLYTYNGPLGISWNGSTPTLRVWAPTARSVKLHIYDNSTTTTDSVVSMASDPATGVWTALGSPNWNGKYYLYEVEVYTRATGKVEKNMVTDPYSVSLSMNSTRSQIVNLDDKSLMPAGWQTLKKPLLASLSDIVIYELHLRDFSASDNTVPANHRGTYLAFTDTNSNGMQHLRALAQAGLTHIHLLPIFDFATVDENKANIQQPDAAQLAAMPPDSDQQQAAITAIHDKDAYNWGYDPYHYGVPEGSYATNPDGPTRILEFRQMVKALSDNGLRTIMDVVYNHTTASGEDPKSVLDKVVPGYYHRLNAQGMVETSTCCQNTASENAMMEKLMVDTLVMWAKEYKVDGFRFDLMGHHMVSNMKKIRAALDSLTPEKDGVDGKKIYVYGEGWNFGEVQDNKRGVNATQANMAGTGIGTFNDRIRDGVRGGGPFNPKPDQGFITGLALDPNGTDQGTVTTQTIRLLHYSDWIKLGLAGNMKTYLMVDSTGKTVTGADVDYNGQPAGYTLQPLEDINYDEAHDNETLFDAITEKVPVTTTMADRVRIQNMGMDVIGLAEGIPFFSAGVDMLRSKSLDGNSYDSGDWFNKLDFTYNSNNFGVGLPPKADNGGSWNLMKPLLANPALKPGKADIMQAVTHFRELLQIRKSSRLFRLESGADVQSRVRFFNNGPNQIPGLIVMAIADRGFPVKLDPNYDGVVVLFNARPSAVTFAESSFAGQGMSLHPVQASSSDPVVRTSTYEAATGTFTVPARTTAVFVAKSLGGGENPGMPRTGSAVDSFYFLLLAFAALSVASGLLLRRSLSRQR